ncbi:MAG: hypothetical protein ACI4R9_03850 [Kiritimatiellia bacterium]
MAGRTIQEKKILSVLGVVLAFALFGFCYAPIVQSWRNAWEGYVREKTRYARERALIAQKGELQEAYDQEKSLMQLFAADEDTKTTWLRKFDKLAEDHRITLTARQALDETQDGEVYELAIEARNWDGTLDHLVPFLHELENTADGMFDIRSLNFKPNPKTGRFRGSLVITCAYMREPTR